MRVHFHEMGLLEELRYRLEHPAALLIVLPNGLVKLINALPFICGDLRTQSLADIWANFQRAWQRSARRAIRRRPRGRSAQDVDAAPVGPALTTPPPRSRRRQRRRRRLLRVVEPGPLPLLSLCGTASLSARRGVGVRDRRQVRGAGLLERPCRRRAGGRRRRSVQRILRRADGHRPGLQSRRHAADRRRWCSGSASPRSPARSRSACT